MSSKQTEKYNTLLKEIAIVLISILLSPLYANAVPITWNGNGHQYNVVHSNSISWDEARKEAQHMGAGWDLASITSAEEQDFIVSLIGPPDGSLVEYYIGGVYSNGSWEWVTKEPFTFAYWGGEHEPNGNAGEPRIALDGRHPNWGWNDYIGDGADFVAGYVAEQHGVYLQQAVRETKIMPLHDSAAVQPGEYVNKVWQGTLSSLFIKTGKKGALTVAIESVSVRGGSCEIEGRQINNGQMDGTDEPCTVTVTPKKGGDIDVKVNKECLSTCGMGANPEGLYMRLRQECTTAALKKVRNEFKQLYDRHAFDNAKRKLKPAFEKCSNITWTGPDDVGWLRNDFALTQYKLHDFEGCRRTLQPLAADAAKTEDELKLKYGVFLDGYMPVIKAARTNLNLCKEK